jgi:galactosylceramidase
VTNWVDEDGSSGGVRSAQCLARIANRQYINGCYTGVYQWHLVSSFYQYFDYNDCGLSIARSPWSGEFEVTSPTWTVAHTTQFSKAGWRYVREFGCARECYTRMGIYCSPVQYGRFKVLGG